MVVLLSALGPQKCWNVPCYPFCFSVVQGAGGMRIVDPLFHRVLVNECRSRRIPVVYDEVFTGFWRLGAEVSHHFLLLLQFGFFDNCDTFNSLPVIHQHFSTVCCRAAWCGTRHSMLRKAPYWWDNTSGCYTGFRWNIWYFHGRVQGIIHRLKLVITHLVSIFGDELMIFPWVFYLLLNFGPIINAFSLSYYSLTLFCMAIHILRMLWGVRLLLNPSDGSKILRPTPI